jgi:hypothetical protein
MLQWLDMYVASVCFKCFSCFQKYVASVLSECCICCNGYTHTLQAYISKCFISFRRLLQQVLHVASVLISQQRKRVLAEAVPACMPSSMACMRSSMACVGAQQQQAHADACNRSMWTRVAGASRRMRSSRSSQGSILRHTTVAGICGRVQQAGCPDGASV